MKETKQQQLVELLKQKGSVDLLDLQRGTHGVRTSNPASLIHGLRKKGYDITTYENETEDGKYISTVYKLNYLPLPKDITESDKRKVDKLENDINVLKERIKQYKKDRRTIINKY